MLASGAWFTVGDISPVSGNYATLSRSLICSFVIWGKKFTVFFVSPRTIFKLMDFSFFSYFFVFFIFRLILKIGLGLRLGLRLGLGLGLGLGLFRVRVRVRVRPIVG